MATSVQAGSVMPARSAAISIDMQTQAARALSSNSCGRMPASPPLPALCVSARTTLRPFPISTQYRLPSRVAVTTAMIRYGMKVATAYAGVVCREGKRRYRYRS